MCIIEIILRVLLTIHQNIPDILWIVMINIFIGKFCDILNHKNWFRGQGLFCDFF